MSDFSSVNLSGTTYLIPKNAASPSWGEQLHDYLLALGISFSTLVGIGDITETGFSIANNQAAPATVVGLDFDSALVRAAVITYSIYRNTDSVSASEAGEMTVIYDSNASIGEKWALQRDSVSDAGVDFFMSDTGVITYTSSNIAGVGYTGLMKFEAKATLQA